MNAFNSSSAGLPTTIPEYLEHLRRSLAGADPALVQDALYDAEEYLRSELAENPGKSEADVIGMMYAASAGYPPDESIELWDRMSKASPSSVPAFLSTHPANDQRKENLREWMPQAKKKFDFLKDVPLKEVKEYLGLKVLNNYTEMMAEKGITPGRDRHETN